MAGIIRTLTPGGGTQNISNLYDNANQGLGFKAFTMPNQPSAQPAQPAGPTFTSPGSAGEKGYYQGMYGSWADPNSKVVAGVPGRTAAFQVDMEALQRQRSSPEALAAADAEWRAAFDKMAGADKARYASYAGATPYEQSFAPGTGGNNKWGSNLAQDATTQRKSTGGSAPYSYIQLANMLSNDTYKNFGLTEDQVINYMNAIKGN